LNFIFKDGDKDKIKDKMELIFEGKPLHKFDENNYINLKTGRRIKTSNINNVKYREFETLDVSEIDPNVKGLVIGPPELILQFKIENGLPIPDHNPDPDPDAEAESDQDEKNVHNVHTIPKEILSELCPFNLRGIFGPARVIDVIDGDTIELAMYVSHKMLTRPIHKVDRGKRRLPVIYTQHKQAGFIMSIRCRLDGIDFAEKNTKQGLIGKRLMINLYEELDNKIWCLTGNYDNHDRILVNLYTDKTRKVSINKYYLDKEFGNFGHFVEIYGGEGRTLKKSAYMEGLPKLSKEKAERFWEKISDLKDENLQIK